MRRTLIVQLPFGANHEVSELLVGGSPGVVRFLVEGIAQGFAHRCEQVLAHDGIVLGLNAQTCVLLGDAPDGGRERSEIVDVGRVGPNRMRKGFRLSAGSLVGVVEETPQLGMTFEEPAVEPSHYGHSVLAENAGARLDDLGLPWAHRHLDLL